MNVYQWVVSNGLSQFGVVLKTTKTIKDTDCVWSRQKQNFGKRLKH